MRLKTLGCVSVSQIINLAVLCQGCTTFSPAGGGDAPEAYEMDTFCTYELIPNARSLDLWTEPSPASVVPWHVNCPHVEPARPETAKLYKLLIERLRPVVEYHFISFLTYTYVIQVTFNKMIVLQTDKDKVLANIFNSRNFICPRWGSDNDKVLAIYFKSINQWGPVSALVD